MKIYTFYFKDYTPMIDPTFMTLVLGEPLSAIVAITTVQAKEEQGVLATIVNSNSLQTIWVHGDNIALVAHCDWGLLMVLLAPVLVHISFAVALIHHLTHQRPSKPDTQQKPSRLESCGEFSWCCIWYCLLSLGKIIN